MSALTFSRSPVVALMLGVLSILSLREQIRPRTTLALFGGTIAFSIALGAMLSKGPDFGSGKSAGRAVIENLAIYFVGGPVGFSEVMADPPSVGEPNLTLRMPLQVLSWLGAQVRMPDHIHGYVTTDLGNVYTFYFPYWFDAGWFGIIAGSFVAGAISTAIYGAARRGHPVAGAAFGLVSSAIITSSVGDGLFSSPTPWILVAVIGWMFWHLPARRAAIARELDVPA